MAKYENKTKPNKGSVIEFLNSIEDEQKRKESKKVIKIMKMITSEMPILWGTSIIGFGNYHYKYESGREGDYMKVGFSPRKQNLTIYIMNGFKKHEKLMDQLGKYKTGKSCLYIKTLDDINLEVLEQLIKDSYISMNKKYG